MTLSQARADSVKEYCTSQECGVDAAYAELFAQSLEAIGYAYDKPVYDAQGGAHTVYFDQSASMLFDMSGNALYASAEAQSFIATIATAEVLFLDYGGLTIALELYH